MTRRQGWESSSGSQATTTKAVTRMMSEMGMEKCTGKMDLCTRENGRKGFKMGLAGWIFPMVE